VPTIDKLTRGVPNAGKSAIVNPTLRPIGPGYPVNFVMLARHQFGRDCISTRCRSSG
jgi:hypothetical protein